MVNLRDVYTQIEAAEECSSKQDYGKASKLHNEVVTMLSNIIDKNELNDDVVSAALRRLLTENKLQALQCKYRNDIERIKQQLLEKENKQRQQQKQKQKSKSEPQQEDTSGILNTEYSLILNSSYKYSGIGGDVTKKCDTSLKSYIIDLFESLEISPVAHDDYDSKHNQSEESSIQKINYRILESKSKEELVMENIQLKQNIYNQNRLLERFYLKTGPQNTDKDIVLIDKKQFMKQLLTYFAKNSSKPESPSKQSLHSSRYLKSANSLLQMNNNNDSNAGGSNNNHTNDNNNSINIGYNSHQSTISHDIIRDYSRISPKRKPLPAVQRDQYNNNYGDHNNHKPSNIINIKANISDNDPTKYSSFKPSPLTNRTRFNSYNNILHSDDDSDEDEDSDIDDCSSGSAAISDKVSKGSQQQAPSKNSRLVNEFAKYMR